MHVFSFRIGSKHYIAIADKSPRNIEYSLMHMLSVWTFLGHQHKQRKSQCTTVNRINNGEHNRLFAGALGAAYEIKRTHSIWSWMSNTFPDPLYLDMKQLTFFLIHHRHSICIGFICGNKIEMRLWTWYSFKITSFIEQRGIRSIVGRIFTSFQIKYMHSDAKKNTAVKLVKNAWFFSLKIMRIFKPEDIMARTSV